MEAYAVMKKASKIDGTIIGFTEIEAIFCTIRIVVNFIG